jgi:hypothetical protein
MVNPHILQFLWTLPITCWDFLFWQTVYEGLLVGSCAGQTAKKELGLSMISAWLNRKGIKSLLPSLLFR